MTKSTAILSMTVDLEGMSEFVKSIGVMLRSFSLFAGQGVPIRILLFGKIELDHP